MDILSIRAIDFGNDTFCKVTLYLNVVKKGVYPPCSKSIYKSLGHHLWLLPNRRLLKKKSNKFAFGVRTIPRLKIEEYINVIYSFFFFFILQYDVTSFLLTTTRSLDNTSNPYCLAFLLHDKLCCNHIHIHFQPPILTFPNFQFWLRSW